MDWLNDLLGLHELDLKAYQMVARAIVIFFISLVLIRIAGMRTLGKQSAFDHLTILLLGAMLGRSIVTNQSFGGTLLAALTVILLHRLIALITYYSRAAGSMFKGDSVVLIKDNQKQIPNMKKSHITMNDIFESLRAELNTDDYNKIKDAYLERSGKISIVENK
jgi:uncharacterized membrane protein YcaP (DUF421 family)